MNHVKKKICLISSSGGHYEQLKMLSSLAKKYDIYFVTEKIKYKEKADYYLFAGSNVKIVAMFHLFLNFFASMRHFMREKPDFIITTGTMVAFPSIVYGKLLKKKIIYIESFARVEGGTKAGSFVYRHRLYDLFIYQWESQSEFYKDGVFGGSIY